MYLIEIAGERQFVESLDGYEDATVVAEDVEPPSDAAAELVDGQWVVPIAVLKARKTAEVDAHLAGQFLLGFAPAAPEAMAGHTLQVRDTVDRTNWLTSQAAYLAAIQAGFGDVVDASFRTAENSTVTLTYAQGHQVLLDMAAWGKALMGKSWALKDAIGALEDPTAVESFDVAAEWAALP